MHKKICPRREMEAICFLIYPSFSFSAAFLHFCHSACHPCWLWMYAETEQHCFYIPLSREFAWPSHPSNPSCHHPIIYFLPVKTSGSRCCYLPGFQQPVTSTTCFLLQKLSPNTSLCALPAAPATCWESHPLMSNLDNFGGIKKNQHKGQDDERKNRT